MKKYYKQLSIIIVIFIASMQTSCNDNDSFTYTLPEQAVVTQVEISLAVSQAVTQCTADVSISSSDEATIYYMFLPSTSVAPLSADLFDDGNILEFLGADSTTFETSNLSEGVSYTLYAISVNRDGLRSEQVFATSYSQPSFQINIDTTYTANPFAFGAFSPVYTATLTPTGTPNEYSIDSAWGPNWVAWATGNGGYSGLFIYPGTLIIGDDYSVTIIGAASDDWYATGGSGSYDPCTNEISYTLTQALFGSPFTVDVTLVPDNF